MENLQTLEHGPGWRVGWRSLDLTFQGLLGTDQWAAELTAAEFKDFCRLLQQLNQALQDSVTELMPEEKISIEAETSLIWMEVAGDPQAYSLSFMILTGRRIEGYWPPPLAPEFIAACQNHIQHLSS
ncbi:DUF1818 family protein [Candidatus Synechococcus calcipolaris G9]|uniref:DUF1818 family protein n=1 Tax=Candidatus Synechococcus calcipolaris G9 TaxID=1497997 RepID=A0ABT6F379_9SYNE|nr:DUF1818 family protein [Candidatus Synechococcus calcipolaris]MDG2992328.1 DUF1818 family protein [Candidatus Synechococcus calcipolaris G9]